MSIVRDPETYEKFEQVILVHGVRQIDELAYHDLLIEHLPDARVPGRPGRRSSCATTRPSRARRTATWAASPS